MSSIITIDLDEVIYDIQNKTYLTGKSRADGANYQQVAQMMANEDEENANQVRRSIHTALGEIHNALADYCRLGTDSVSNLYDEKTNSVTLICEMPSNFNQAALNGVALCIHQYVVARAVADWFTITHKADSGDYQAQATACLKTLAESLSKRNRPTRKVAEN